MQIMKFIENYFYIYLVLLVCLLQKLLGQTAFCWSFGSIRVDVQNVTQISEKKIRK